MSRRRRYFTQTEMDYVRKLYKRYPTSKIAQHLKRDVQSIYRLARRLGIHEKIVCLPDRALIAAIKKYHPKGWSDTEIKSELEKQTGVLVNRHRIGQIRKELRLPNNVLSEHRRRQVAAKTREQLDAAGLESLAGRII